MIFKLSNYTSDNPEIEEIDAPKIVKWMKTEVESINGYLALINAKADKMRTSCIEAQELFKSRYDSTMLDANAKASQLDYEKVKHAIPEKLQPYTELDNRIRHLDIKFLGELHRHHPKLVNTVLTYRLWNRYKGDGNSTHLTRINSKLLFATEWFQPNYLSVHAFNCPNCGTTTTVKFVCELDAAKYPCQNCNTYKVMQNQYDYKNTPPQKFLHENFFTRNNLTISDSNKNVLANIVTEVHKGFDTYFNAQPSEFILKTFFTNILTNETLDDLLKDVTQCLESSDTYNRDLLHLQKIRFNNGGTGEAIKLLKNYNPNATSATSNDTESNQILITNDTEHRLTDQYDLVIHFDGTVDRKGIADAIYSLDYTSTNNIDIDTQERRLQHHPAYSSNELADSFLFAIKQGSSIKFV